MTSLHVSVSQHLAESTSTLPHHLAESTTVPHVLHHKTCASSEELSVGEKISSSCYDNVFSEITDEVGSTSYNSTSVR